MNDGGKAGLNNPAYHGPFEEESIDLKKYWSVVSRRKWSILFLAVLVALLATLIAYSLTPIYKATSTLLIEPERQKSFSIEAMVRFQSQSKEYYLTQMEILKSRMLAERVIGSLDLANDPEFIHKEEESFISLATIKHWLSLISTTEKKSHRASEDVLMGLYADKLMGNLSVTLLKGTQLIKLTYQSDSPVLTAKVSNALANVYIEGLISSRIDKARQTTAWMGQRLLVLKKSLQVSDQALQVYKERNGLIDIRGVNELTADELGQLTSKLLTTRSKYNELSKVYGPKHPKMILAISELKVAKRELSAGKLNIQIISRKAVKLRELQRQVNSDRELYDIFLGRLKEVSQVVEFQHVNARISDFAVVPEKPFKPKKIMLISLAFFASLMFGVFLAFLYDALDKTFKTTADIEDKLNVPILGLLPFIKKNKKDRKEQTFAMLDPKQTPFAEAMRTIRTGLVLSSLDNPHKIILVTSSVPGEGKTIVSTNLAIAMAKMEKVLLIGSDLRRPSLSRAVGLHEHKLGISSIVAGTADFKDCIHHLDVAGIDVLPCGQVPPNPLELLSSERYAKMLTVLEKYYDRIIIDSPPVQAVSDALVLSKYAKAVVYVIEADSTHEHAAKSGINRLLEQGAPIAGVILNKFNASEGSDYGYSSGGYYDLHGYSEA